ncbi:hypothetical protein PVL29_025942 [Vitis rotundifolia]|uniref:Retrotransposon Copia-like N-terminal domain-containing protein n=1 Tax=Vitis rotundifolia TaxID=103349 RepID=A0AA39D5D3_VITRO|nr:hypothetical protein PVL29_025942 [Vitis rotundifolia]
MARDNQPNQRVVIGSSEVSAMEDVSSHFFFTVVIIPDSSFRAMAMALIAKNKIGFVDGTIPRATQTDFLFNAWNCRNSMVTSWIINSVSKDIANSLMYIATAAEIWTDL